MSKKIAWALLEGFRDEAPVAQKLDGTIYRTNSYPEDDTSHLSIGGGGGWGVLDQFLGVGRPLRV